MKLKTLFLVTETSLGIMGIPLIICLWELMPNMKIYQIISMLITAILWYVACFSLEKIHSRLRKMKVGLK